MDYSIISASSVPSESTFSESGHLQKKQRSSLDPQKLQYSMFLKNADDVLSSFKKTNKSDKKLFYFYFKYLIKHMLFSQLFLISRLIISINNSIKIPLKSITTEKKPIKNSTTKTTNLHYFCKRARASSKIIFLLKFLLEQNFFFF